MVKSTRYCFKIHINAHLLRVAVAEIESCRNIPSRDKLTNGNRFINRNVLDNGVSLFRVHFTVSYSQIYCGRRSGQAFHRRYRAFTPPIFIGVAPYLINQIWSNSQKYQTSAIIKTKTCENEKRALFVNRRADFYAVRISSFYRLVIIHSNPSVIYQLSENIHRRGIAKYNISYAIARRNFQILFLSYNNLVS